MNLSELPIELLADNLFPFLPARDLNQLACTCKFFAILCSDDAVWKRKLLADFNFSGEGTARRSGWKTIYRGLYNPKVFVWGECNNGRLGMPKSALPHTNGHGVPFPVQLKIPGVRVISIAAGGMSFHALDSEGNVYVWGTLNANMSYALPSDGFSEPGKEAPTPVKLKLPTAIRSISCGRLHSSVLDHQNKIWTFVNCGWSHSALLTTGGEVYAWWPFSGSLQEVISQRNSEFDSAGDKKAKETPDGIACVTWSTDVEPTRLPALPRLPELNATGIEADEPPRLAQIAGMDGRLVGLTNHGHVLKFDSLSDEGSVASGEWKYLPLFSDLDSIRRSDVMNRSEGGPGSQKVDLPETLHITHISANFQHFVAYSTGSSSMVLIGNTDTTPASNPQVKPELQNRSVISVVIGDYHNAALTSEGKVLTWGEYASGALGLGDPRKLQAGQPGGYAVDVRSFQPPAVQVPTEVRFDHGSKTRKDRYCFAVTAAGWHTGALVIDLELDEEEEVYETEANSPTPKRSNFRWVRRPGASAGTPSLSQTQGSSRGRGRGFPFYTRSLFRSADPES